MSVHSSSIHKSENPGVVEISRRVHELGVIEYIERFCTELHLHTFCDLRLVQQSHMKVVDTRSAKRNAA